MDELEVKRIQGEVQTLWTEMKSVLVKEADERKKFGDGKAETKQMIDRINDKITELETKMSRPAIGETAIKEPTLEYKAYVKFLRNKDLTVDETKALSTSDDVSGGYLVPREVSKQILAAIETISPFRKLCNVITIGTSALDIAKDKAGVYTSYWDDEAEVEQGGNFGKETIPAHSQRKTVIVTPEMIEDSVINIDSYVRGKIVQAFAKKEGTAFVSGDGVERPEGFLTNTEVLTDYTPSGDASVIKPDSLIDLSFALKEGYFANATFVMNRMTLKAIRKLVKIPSGGATAGDYIWTPGYGNLPSTILGYPYVLVGDMPDIASNSYPVAFGDFRAGYTIVDRLGISIQKLFEKYTPNIGYLARGRVGGQTVMAEAIKVLKIASS